MEAAALYAFATAREKDVVCFAHVTNQMGQAGDFEKGEFNGATGSLKLDRAETAARVGPRDATEKHPRPENPSRDR
jgi:hypothetical protein